MKYVLILFLILLFTIGCGSDYVSKVKWTDVPDRPDGSKCWMLIYGNNLVDFVGVSCENRKD